MKNNSSIHCEKKGEHKLWNRLSISNTTTYLEKQDHQNRQDKSITERGFRYWFEEKSSHSNNPSEFLPFNKTNFLGLKKIYTSIPIWSLNSKYSFARTNCSPWPEEECEGDEQGVKRERKEGLPTGQQQNTNRSKCEGLNCVPWNSHDEVLAPSTSEYGFIWREGL